MFLFANWLLFTSVYYLLQLVVQSLCVNIFKSLNKFLFYSFESCFVFSVYYLLLDFRCLFVCLFSSCRSVWLCLYFFKLFLVSVILEFILYFVKFTISHLHHYHLVRLKNHYNSPLHPLKFKTNK